uniref:NudC domain-containing protein 1 n=1 Tax=Romanomermis culicivorax TaxID=13658 RepID=A0A915JVW7_ROMCU
MSLGCLLNFRFVKYSTKNVNNCRHFCNIVHNFDKHGDNSATTSSEKFAGTKTTRKNNAPSYMHIHCTEKWPDDMLKSIVEDIVVLDDFVNDVEESEFVAETKVPLKRLRYENAHWDDAIELYREIERKNWGPICTQVIERIRKTAFTNQAQHLPLVHVLDVAAEGCVKPHIDSVRYCGNVIAGVSLLTDSVMRLVHEKRQELMVDLLLSRRSLYILRGIGRYKFTHEVLRNDSSFFNGVKIEKGRRISIICRESSGSDNESYLRNMPNFVDFKINRDLLNPSFEGYKLSLESFPSKSFTLPEAVYRPAINQSQYSLLHQHLFVNHNFLIHDFWLSADESQRNVIRCFVTTKSGVILEITYFKESGNCNISAAVQLDNQRFSNLTDTEERKIYNVTISLPSVNLAFVADGLGDLLLFDRSDEKWSILFENSTVVQNQESFVVVDSIYRSGDSSLQCLLKTVVAQQSKSSSFQNEFILLDFVQNDKMWQICRKRSIHVKNVVEFSSLSRSDKLPNLICLLTSGDVEFFYDSQRPVVTAANNVSTKIYTWRQTNDRIFVEVAINSKIEPKVDIERKSIRIFDSESQILNGELFDEICEKNSKWSFDIATKKLVIEMVKLEADNHWTEFIIGDTNGEYLADKNSVAQMGDTMMDFTTDQEVKADPFTSRPAFNAEDIEECDMGCMDSLSFNWLDANEHKIIHSVDLGGHQWLFSAKYEDPSAAPSICLRYDVDGILWRAPSDPFADSPSFSAHFLTFDAFGYVVAGKEARRLVGCSPRAVYCAIADSHRNIYVYWRPNKLQGQMLKNRKTGQNVQTVCKQNLLTVDAGDQEILGMITLDDHLLILTDSQLTVFVMSASEVN